MLRDDLRGLRIWPVNIKRNGSRAFRIAIVVVSCLDLMLPLCNVVKGLKEVTVIGDVICRSAVNNPIIGRSIGRCHIDRDHRFWRRVRERVGMYNREEE
jgi:hypothetical protein